MRIEDLAGLIEAVGFRSGTWFYIPDDAIFRRLDNKEFAWAKRNKTEDDTRPVLLGNPLINLAQMLLFILDQPTTKVSINLTTIGKSLMVVE